MAGELVGPIQKDMTDIEPRRDVAPPGGKSLGKEVAVRGIADTAVRPPKIGQRVEEASDGTLVYRDMASRQIDIPRLVDITRRPTPQQQNDLLGSPEQTAGAAAVHTLQKLDKDPDGLALVVDLKGTRDSDQIADAARRHGIVVDKRTATPSELAKGSTIEQLTEAIMKTIPSSPEQGPRPERGILRRIMTTLNETAHGPDVERPAPELPKIRDAAAALQRDPERFARKVKPDGTPIGLTEAEKEEVDAMYNPTVRESHITGGRFLTIIDTLDVLLDREKATQAAEAVKQQQITAGLETPQPEGLPQIVIVQNPDFGLGDQDAMQNFIAARLAQQAATEFAPGVPSDAILLGVDEVENPTLWKQLQISLINGGATDIVRTFDPRNMTDEQWQALGGGTVTVMGGAENGLVAERISNLFGSVYDARVTGTSKGNNSGWSESSSHSVSDSRDKNRSRSEGHKMFGLMKDVSTTRGSSRSHSTTKGSDVGRSGGTTSDETTTIGEFRQVEASEIIALPSDQGLTFSRTEQGVEMTPVHLALHGHAGPYVPLENQLENTYRQEIAAAQQAQVDRTVIEPTPDVPQLPVRKPGGFSNPRGRIRATRALEVAQAEKVKAEEAARKQKAADHQAFLGRVSDAGLTWGHLVTPNGELREPDRSTLTPRQQQSVIEIAVRVAQAQKDGDPNPLHSVIRKLGSDARKDREIINAVLERHENSREPYAVYVEDALPRYEAARQRRLEAANSDRHRAIEAAEDQQNY